MNTWGPALCWQLQGLVGEVRPALPPRVFLSPGRKKTAFAQIALRNKRIEPQGSTENSGCWEEKEISA